MPVRPRLSPLVASILLCLPIAQSVVQAAAPVVAQEPSPAAVQAARSDPHLLLLQSGLFDPLQQQVETSALGVGPAAATDYAIVQFHPGQTHAAAALARRGARLLGYVPNHAYYVKLGGRDLDALRREPGVRWAGVVTPAMKLAPPLWQARRLDSEARQADGRYIVEISGFAGVAASRLAAGIAKSAPDAVILDAVDSVAGPSRLRVQTDAAGLDVLIEAATALEGVEYVAPWTQPEPANAGAAAAMQGNLTAACAGSGAPCAPTPLWDQGIYGTGQIVAVADSGTDANEAWFTTLDRGNGPLTAITVADAPAALPPALGTLHPDHKIIGYWVQPGASAYDGNARCTPNSSPIGWHGTHVAGTVLGDAAGLFGSVTYQAATPTALNHELADGMAPNAQLLMQDIGNDPSGCLSITDFAATLQQAHAAGARVHNNSWGNAGSWGRYQGNDVDVDHTTWSHEDLLVVVAAGNSGRNGTSPQVPPCGGELIDGVCIRSVGSPGNAKNALTVGALGHAGATAVAGFSSRGLTADGRLKPDIMAPGTGTISASGDDTTNDVAEAPLSKSMSGTSMAAPTISGNAALVRQFFADGFYPRGVRTPADTYAISGMSLKAVLLNGTNVLQPATWPNRDIGWGRAWLDGNLWFADTKAGGEDSRRLRLFERTQATGLETGEVAEYAIGSVAAGQELRATLTWFDPEGSLGSALSLVNDLDLEVVAPDGAVYRGNQFAGGVSATGAGTDAVNTVEQVRLTAPAAGRYTLRVRAAAVPGNGREGTDRQGYALAVSGAFGLPDRPALAAPAGVGVTGNDLAGVRVGFALPAGASGAQLYRADGSCASAAAGDFRLAAHGIAAPLTDTRAVGGERYAYKVRAIGNDVEGQASTCVDVVSAADCERIPIFDLDGLRANGASASCAVALDWPAAEATCPASTGMRYTVERDTDPFFGNPRAIATNLATTSFVDTDVADGRRYSYRVSAVDSYGNASAVSLPQTTTPSGASGPDPAGFVNDVDQRSYLHTQAPWRITAAAAHDGRLSYRSGADGANYPDQTCGAITTPPLTLPPGAALTFAAKYDLEREWDGVALEISTDGGATWADLPPEVAIPARFLSRTAPMPAAIRVRKGHSAVSARPGPMPRPMARRLRCSSRSRRIWAATPARPCRSAGVSRRTATPGSRASSSTR